MNTLSPDSAHGENHLPNWYTTGEQTNTGTDNEGIHMNTGLVDGAVVLSENTVELANTHDKIEEVHVSMYIG